MAPFVSFPLVSSATFLDAGKRERLAALPADNAAHGSMVTTPPAPPPSLCWLSAGCCFPARNVPAIAGGQRLEASGQTDGRLDYSFGGRNPTSHGSNLASFFIFPPSNVPFHA